MALRFEILNQKDSEMPVDPISTWLHRNIVTDIVQSPRFYIPFLTSVLANLVWYWVAEHSLLKFIYGNIKDYKSQKAKAWVSTCLSSTVLVLGGIPAIIEFVNLNPSETTADMISKDSSYSWGLGAFFAGFLLADCVLGCISYPKQFHILTGWIHHFSYIYVVLWHIQCGQIGIFMPCVAFAEVSTLFLALGTINSKWRNDLGFGISFLIGRILFHACVVVYAFQTYKNNYWIAPALPFPLHVHWFYKWTLGYLYPKKKIE